MWRVTLLLLIPLIALSTIPAFFSAIAISKPAYASSSTTSSICCGVSEDYELALDYQQIPSNLTQAWINYYTNSTFQSLKTKFGWDVIRLGFKFSANDSSSNDQFLNVSNFANLDLAVSMAAQYRFKVILDDFDYQTGYYGSSAWYYDWNVTAEHYKGDSNIVLFNVANEMEANNTGTNNNGCGSVGTEAIVCLDKVTDNVQSIDPSRAVGWWVYSITDYPTVPPADELRSNTYADLHVSTYTSNTTCATLSKLENAVENGLLKFQRGSNMTGIVGEINTQNSICNSVSSAFIQYLVQNNVPWIASEYSTYSANWISILNNVSVTTSTSSSSTTDPSTMTATSSSSISSSSSSTTTPTLTSTATTTVTDTSTATTTATDTSTATTTSTKTTTSSVIDTSTTTSTASTTQTSTITTTSTKTATSSVTDTSTSTDDTTQTSTVTTTATDTSTSTSTSTATSTTTATTTSTETVMSTTDSTATGTATTTSTVTATSTPTVTSTTTVSSTVPTTSTSTVTTTVTSSTAQSSSTSSSSNSSSSYTNSPSSFQSGSTTNAGTTTNSQSGSSTSTSSSTNSSTPSQNSNFLGLDQKKVTALTYGSSTSAGILGVGLVAMFLALRKQSRGVSESLGTWHW